MSFVDNTFEFYINSSINKQSTDTSSNWTTYFNSVLLQPDANYEIGVSSVQIPNTAPQFHDTEKTFTINDGTDDLNFTLDNSIIFSNTADLVTYLNSLVNISGFTFSVDDSTKKLKANNQSTESITLLNSLFFTKLGFGNDDFVINASSDKLALYFCSLISTARYYVICEEIKNNSYAGENYKNWSILCSVNVNVAIGSYVNLQSNNNIYFHQLKPNGSINNLSFRVVDDKFRTVDLNNVGVMLSLIMRKINSN